MTPVRQSVGLNLRAGELVEVLAKEEILATLNEKGELDALPFMPEMFKYCGRQLRVFKSAHKTCDTVDKNGGLQLPATVHLERSRCDGQAHGGCQAACLLFWKEAWLKRVVPAPAPAHSAIASAAGCFEEVVWSNVRPPTTALVDRSPEVAVDIYKCQATELLKFTKPLQWWDVRQYIKDLTSRNIALPLVVHALLFRMFLLVLRVGAYRVLTESYDRIQHSRGGIPFPYREGKLTGTTPSQKLNLQVGEVVQVKSHAEILATVNKHAKNRGLRFDAEMVAYCGKTFRVLGRVDRMIDEKTGVMVQLPNECIILEDVICGSQYSALRVFCPRSVYIYWREIWLRRVPYRTPLSHCTEPIVGESVSKSR